VNKHLLRELNKLGLWNDEMKNKLIAANGSVQNIDEVPDNLKALYKTAWELSQKVIINMAADRGAYIDQSQSLNLFLENANFSKMTSMHFYAWKSGLKTGMYYMRTKAAADAIKFTVDKKYKSKPSDKAVVAESAEVSVNSPAGSAAAPEQSPEAKATGSEVSTPSGSLKTMSEQERAEYEAAVKACSIDNGPDCEMCSG
jgi:ribonucleoside-diphosphate reductase alpha chain